MKDIAGRVISTTAMLATVYGALGALNACQAPLPVSPEMRCAFEPGCGATDYPSVGRAKDAGGE